MATSIEDLTLFILWQEFLHGARHRSMFASYQYLYSLLSPTVCHKSSIRHAIRSLARKKLITIFPDGEINLIQLSKNGKGEIMQRYEYLRQNNIVTSTPHMWMIVLLDVPESKRKIRDDIRNHLVQSGFKQWKRAVYLYPFRKENPTNIIKYAEKKNWEPYVQIFSTDKSLFGSTDEEIFEELFKTDTLTSKALYFMDQVEQVASQLNKKALNSYQRKSSYAKGQNLLAEMFSIIVNVAEQKHAHVSIKPSTLLSSFKSLCNTLEAYSSFE